ncbi:MAG: hypothetical protein KF749_14555 [Bacteroidetes bacterium]|nr:hypothetical protein [Bacteroidota bacterium]MCW5895724.1 hypothetical protein [Bacteroidota bacterium]
MNIKLSFLLLCFALLGFAPQPDNIEKEFTVSPGKKLEVDLKTGGSLKITGWDKNVVKVNGTIKGRDAEDCVVEVVEEGGGVRISSYYEGRRRNYNTNVDFEIQVPRKFNLDLKSMGGSFTIENVEGTIEGKTMGGALTLTKLKGDLDLTTMGGKVRLTDSDVDGKVKTMGGEVLVEDVKGTVKASSMGGKVIQRNVTGRSGEGIKNEVHIRTMGGGINVDDAPEGTDVHTMGGNIHIRKAAKYARAKTMGGNIEIDAVDGRVSATTMGGDVNVTMIGDATKGDRDVEIESMSGDVTLTVPSSLSMDVDITLAYTRGKEGDYKIVSDFDLKREETKEWERRNGSPRKYIYGTGTIGGGKHKVKIKTINGNVYLKKG